MNIIYTRNDHGTVVHLLYNIYIYRIILFNMLGGSPYLGHKSCSFSLNCIVLFIKLFYKSQSIENCYYIYNFQNYGENYESLIFELLRDQ